ncbi:senescence-associated family protein [Tripterygium wilfordii]|uniref:Senescence-associated family protein n=1 Tax=Tripterygium wilfordii TaxID=458696 RepID=A0A7J7D1P0_TRIWF|nr:FCS-Like Zinc finger 5-like [Tripterygium wilfordii]KAF5740251.1 senescence-associated family protein [Tripterygium wilfordii]
MSLGKRPRHPMKRTTSMSEITFDLTTSSAAAATTTANTESEIQKQADGPRAHHRKTASSIGFLETPFLRSCSLCRRRLVPGRDIYMYRGDSAFCSLECRQHQMNDDERIEKCSLASKKVAVSTTGAAQISTKAAVQF